METKKERRFTGYEHAPTGRRFRSWERAYQYARKYGKRVEDGPNDIWTMDKSVHIDTTYMTWGK